MSEVKFVHEKNYSETVTTVIEYVTITGEVCKEEISHPAFVRGTSSPNVVLLEKLPTYGDVFPVDKDSDYFRNLDGSMYWCVEINGTIYRTKHCMSRPDWATHLIYFSK